LLSSDSREIFDEIQLIYPKKISEGNIFEDKSAEFREKILESERDNPEIQGGNAGAFFRRQKKREAKGLSFVFAGDRTRTSTLLLEVDFESTASAISPRRHK
jgi:hypothetical protein